ncbi:MAG TPA: ABC transporter permease [Chloroflexota bacterium]|nr:ABC transporter permease [Chloroflexota bacterium]
MNEPNEELTAVLSADQPTPISPSATAQVLLEQDDQIAVRQLSQLQLTWIRFRRHKVAMAGAVILLFFVVVAIFGPLISPESYYQVNQNALFQPPTWSWRYLMGADADGHAVMMWVILGARPSLEIGFLSAGLATVIGIIVGAVSGYFGGFVDAVCMRVTDVFLTLPFLPLLLLLGSIIGGGNVWFIVVVFGVLGWSGSARLIRSYYLTFRQQEFTEAARAVGVSSTRIIFRHILPNALSPIIVSFTLLVAAFIVTEAAIDFLGQGLKPPSVSWGLALAGAQSYTLLGIWWWMVFPGACLLLVVLAVNFIGDGLRDALDVRAKTVD